MLEKKGQLQRTGRKEEKGKAEAAGVQIDVAEGPATTRKVCLTVRLVCTCPNLHVWIVFLHEVRCLMTLYNNVVMVIGNQVYRHSLFSDFVF